MRNMWFCAVEICDDCVVGYFQRYRSVRYGYPVKIRVRAQSVCRSPAVNILGKCYVEIAINISLVSPDYARDVVKKEK